MDTERSFRIRLTVPSLAAVAGLPIDNGCMPIRRRPDGLIELEAIVPEQALAALKRRRRRGVTFEVLADRTEELAAARRLVSPINRYADGRLPQGLGTPMKGRKPAREGE